MFRTIFSGICGQFLRDASPNLRVSCRIPEAKKEWGTRVTRENNAPLTREINAASSGIPPDALFFEEIKIGMGLAITKVIQTKSERLGQFSWFGAASELPWLEYSRGNSLFSFQGSGGVGDLGNADASLTPASAFLFQKRAISHHLGKWSSVFVAVAPWIFSPSRLAGSSPRLDPL
ncbi:MAG TPA: hypothetical protein VHH73_11400 [Verrucomicrobiae bacterium]|nr:hypothetical protein [Verrucomicrobiae bacterium]